MHLGLLPVTAHRTVALLNLELVVELVRCALPAHAGAAKILGEQAGDDTLLIPGKVRRVDRCNHFETGQTATADKSHLHGHAPTATALRCCRLEISTMRVSGLGP